MAGGFRIAVVIPTKDRPREVAAILETLARQTLRPVEVLVVDGGTVSAEPSVRARRDPAVRRIVHRPPSAAGQRNAGVRSLQSDANLVALLDDDILLADDALERMAAFWERAGADVAGASLNLEEEVHPGVRGLKGSRFVTWLGLYDRRPGHVAPSGWQTAVRVATEDVYVQWIPTTGAVWRRDVFEDHAFDGYFKGYSYLEDLDFSYGIGRRRRLAVVADARMRHAISAAGRLNAFGFGEMEVRNRLYVVRKHGLSLPRCAVGLLVRWAMTLREAAGSLSPSAGLRAAGNVAGLLGVGPVLDRARKVQASRLDRVAER